MIEIRVAKILVFYLNGVKIPSKYGQSLTLFFALKRFKDEVNSLCENFSEMLQLGGAKIFHSQDTSLGTC